MKLNIQLFLDPEGKPSGIEIPKKRVSAHIASASGQIEFSGPAEFLGLVTDVLKTSFTSGIKKSVFEMLDKGTLIRYGANANNATVILYTVPAEKDFYFLHYDLDVHQEVAGDVYGWMWISNPAGTEQYGVGDLRLQAGQGYAKHTQGDFTFCKLTTGFYILIGAGVNTYSTGNIIGVEIDRA